MVVGQNGTPTSPCPDISFPVNRPARRREWSTELDAELRAQEASVVRLKNHNTIPRAFWPGGDRSLSGIAIRAFLLGVTLGLSSLFSLALLLYYQNRLWRAPFFIATLCVFHFLEFWTTAAYNTPTAFVSSFLLTNGSRYRQAHSFALVETLITSYFFPHWQALVNPLPIILLGLVMITVGQVVRSLAMAQAGTNFNHQVQSQKNEGHELVTSGLYSIFRHPSYFGFFWWGLGTQVALGNCVSFAGYAAVLWYFFNTRINHEEKHLVKFFGEEYKAYKERTRVWIPFI
ncbi:prenyl cysteine carboxyl methyltransferas-like protein Ste14 [Lindgomyces ingoldianus]|uniref:Prenyl cysteine carboxyl methyltransferas-like protein Ste14 n=1 Tax=Lindgomyces ingoldianus TaxID=673940 RepID=A0ACB6REF4_9PLEO|nr:prenyl cysteine carboxyl methyltransferas-like protein Ste14 [Lindgomyces ingoldianus]KAF2477521.1 prenyl cysteine carboxyl methyltransferas-like protein Ste14 [Lindgomyces ingoldianus]